MQILVWRMAGSLLAYVLIGPTAILVTSAVTMTYIFTNHFLNPILPSADPLLGTTSVVVPWWMDKLPSNFSYHVEHHLFPAMSPRFYPEVSRLLRANHSDRYQRIGLLEAWKSLARRPPWAIVADNEIGLVPKPAGRRE